MKNLFKSTLVIFALLIGLIMVSLFGLAWFTRPVHVNVDSTLSPDGALVAHKSQLGDRESYSFEIRIENLNQMINQAETVGTVYRYDKNSCDTQTEIKWKSNNEVAIYYPDSATVDLTSKKVQLGGRSVSVSLYPTPRDQWKNVSRTELPPCSRPKLKTLDWEASLE